MTRILALSIVPLMMLAGCANDTASNRSATTGQEMRQPPPSIDEARTTATPEPESAPVSAPKPESGATRGLPEAGTTR